MYEVWYAACNSRQTRWRSGMKEMVLSLMTGAVCGVTFALFKLPVPAPTVIPGLLGIFGIFLGYQLTDIMFK
jgi:XapX domain-containing protein